VLSVPTSIERAEGLTSGTRRHEELGTKGRHGEEIRLFYRGRDNIKEHDNIDMRKIAAENKGKGKHEEHKKQHGEAPAFMNAQMN
jgi:hypothetical protein